LLSLGKCWLFIGLLLDQRQEAAALTLALESKVFLNFVLYRAGVMAFYVLTAPWNVEYMTGHRFNNREIQLQRCQSTSAVPAQGAPGWKLLLELPTKPSGKGKSRKR